MSTIRIASALALAVVAACAAIDQSAAQAQQPAKPDAQTAPAPTAPAPAAPAPAAAQAARPAIWTGQWKLITGGKTHALQFANETVGTVGGTVNGQLTLDGTQCTVSGAWLLQATGLYPDGAQLQAIPLARLINLNISCPDGRRGATNMYFVPNETSAIGAAGRIQWSDADGRITSLGTVAMER